MAAGPAQEVGARFREEVIFRGRLPSAAGLLSFWSSMVAKSTLQIRQQARALLGWVRDGDKTDLANTGFLRGDADELMALRRVLAAGDSQMRANSAFLETAGAYTIAELFLEKLDFQLRFFAAVRQLATIVTTDKGGALAYPIVEDFDNEGVQTGENASVGTLDVEQFGQVKLFPQKINSKFLLVPNELFEDAPEAFIDWLARIIGERCGRGANRLYTNTIIASAPVGVTTASATAIAGDELLTLYYGVDPAYRDSPTSGWLVHSGMTAYIRKLKDTSDRYLFRKSKKPGSPDTLLGKPIIFNLHMSNAPTASTVSALFRDLSKVLIRDVQGIRIKRAVERWAEYDQTGIAGYLRTSCAILDAGGQPIQSLVQHS
jgi:HK97 family phage major capsid protein